MYVHRYANDSRDSGTSRSSAPPLPPVPSGHRATRGSTYLVDCSGAGKCGKKQQQQQQKKEGWPFQCWKTRSPARGCQTLKHASGAPPRRLLGVGEGKGGGEGVIRLQFSLAVAILRAGEREEDRCDISPPLRLSTSVRSAIRYRVLIRVIIQLDIGRPTLCAQRKWYGQ